MRPKLIALALRRMSLVTAIERDPEHLGGGRLVDVLALGEGGQQPLVTGEVGHDAQLDLGVVRRHQLVTGARNEGLPDAAPLFVAYRDVLQVGIGGREPTGRRHRLMIGGVHPPGLRLDHQRQLVGVGGLELGQPTVLHQQLRQLIGLRQLGQHLFRSGWRSLGVF
jgi:hypothetical protein